MNKNKIAISFVFATLILTTIACGFSFSSANIDDAFMARDAEGVDKTTVFDQGDTFYCIVVLANAPDDTQVKAVWTAVDVENTDPDFVIDEIEDQMGSGVYHFSLTPDSMWPFGRFKVDLYLNGELDRTLEFEVR